MSTLAIVHGRIITPDAVLEHGTIIIENQRIAAILPYTYCPAGARRIDASGLSVVPGFIDVHVHGGVGYDVMEATPQALSGMAEFFALHGVTSFLPTTVTAPPHAVLAAVENVTRYQSSSHGGSRILGIHLEGPYLNTKHAGAQAVEHMRPPDPAEYQRLFAAGTIRLLSLAPEIPGSSALIEYAIKQGTTVALVHSGATYEEVMAAVELGLNHASHTFNGMAGLHHRTPGTVGAVLTNDAIYAQAIADLHHLHPAVIALLVRAKGPERVVLITDSIRAAGMPEGEYKEGVGQSITVKNGMVTLTYGNSLAGSVLTMDQALRNTMAVTGLLLEQAWPMASWTPAKSLGLGHELGAILPGYIADLVLLDDKLKVQATLIQGEIAYQGSPLTIS